MNQDTFLISIILMELTTFMWLILYVGKNKIIKCGISKVLIELLFFIGYAKIILYYLLPLILRSLSGYQFELEDGINPIKLIKVYAIECISLGIYVTTIFLVAKILFPRKNSSRNNLDQILINPEFAKFFLILISVGFTYFLGASIISPGEQGNLIYDISKSGLFFYGGVSTGPIMMILGGKYLGRKYLYAGILLTMLGVATISTRGALVYLILFIYFLVWYVTRDKISKIFLISTTITFAAIFMIFGGVPKIALSIDDSGQIQIDAGTSSEKNEGRTALQEIEWRFGAATRMGTNFFVLYDRGDGAGFSPIINSLKSGVPRYFSPEKPIPSTVDPEDIYTQGMYVISRETHGYDTFSMVEFPSGGHYYWELGYIGVLFFSILSGIYTTLCLAFFKRFGLMAFSLTLAIMKPWGYMEPKIWLSDAIMQIYQIIIPVAIIYFVYFFSTKIKKIISSNANNIKN